MIMRWPWSKKQKEADHILLGPGVPVFEEHSLTWQWLRQQVQDKLDQARQDNDAIGRDDIQTAYLRGRISIYKELLGIPGEQNNARQRVAHASAQFWPDED